MVAVALEPREFGPGTALGPARSVTARVTATDPAGTSLLFHGLDRTPGGTPARIALPGRHNAQDALCVAAAAAVLGVPVGAIVEGLASFGGVGRRMELKGEPAGVVVLDDYAHHPTAIAETLGAVRQRYPGRRLWAVYEPLTYHRTAALLDRFAAVLAGGADAVVIAEIWAGRDPDTTIASAAGLAAHVRPGDVVLVMGGGHSYRIAERLVEVLGATAL